MEQCSILRSWALGCLYLPQLQEMKRFIVGVRSNSSTDAVLGLPCGRAGCVVAMSLLG